MKARQFIIFTALLVGALNVKAAIWQDTNTWDQGWEDKYSQFVENEFNEDFFIKGRLGDFPTDCADAVYLSRYVFAYENKLPFVIKNPSGKGLISNRSTQFDSITDEAKRVRKFAFWLTEEVSTQSLPNDTYPAKIGRDYIRAGAVWARPRIRTETIVSRVFGGRVREESGHAEIVKRVTETGAVQLIGSTVPQEVRKLISTSSLVFMPELDSTGLRIWKQPHHYGMKSDDLPGFSREQYEMGKKDNSNKRKLDRWLDEVQDRLALRAETREEALQRSGDNICNLFHARNEAVISGDNYRKKVQRCMDKDEFDSYSTPSRDKRIATSLKEMIMTNGDRMMTKGNANKLSKYFNSCPQAAISTDRKITLNQFLQEVAQDNISSNPNDNLSARWGLDGADKNRSCPTKFD